MARICSCSYNIHTFLTPCDYLLTINGLQSDLVLDYDLVDLGDPTGAFDLVTHTVHTQLCNVPAAAHVPSEEPVKVTSIKRSCGVGDNR